MAYVSTRPYASAPRVSVLRAVWTALQVKRQRSQLAHLDDAMLRDIGLTRREAQEEAQRPVWDVPHMWLK